jgi:hypothetical protein
MRALLGVMLVFLDKLSWRDRIEYCLLMLFLVLIIIIVVSVACEKVLPAYAATRLNGT